MAASWIPTLSAGCHFVALSMFLGVHSTRPFHWSVSSPFTPVSVALSLECHRPSTWPFREVGASGNFLPVRGPRLHRVAESGPADPRNDRSGVVFNFRDRNIGEKLSFDRPNGHGLKGFPSTIADMSLIGERNPMSRYHCRHRTTIHHSPSPVTRLASNPLQHHTHVQQVARCLHVDT